MAFWDNMLGQLPAISGLGGTARKGFKKTLRANDFTITADVTESVSSDKYYKVGQYTIPAQQSINIGQGKPSEPDNQGYVYVQIKNSEGTEFDGLIRLAVANANETAIDVIWEERTQKTDGSTSLRTQMIAFPEVLSYPVLGRNPREDDRIQLYMKSDSASQAYSYTTSTVLIPVTVYQ
jgi:hypothetical protein